MVDIGHVKKFSHVILLFILLVLYYILYMEHALENYSKKRTTIVQSQKVFLNLSHLYLLYALNPLTKLRSSEIMEEIVLKVLKNIFGHIHTIKAFLKKTLLLQWTFT